MYAALLIFLIIACDQLTKLWIVDNFALYESKIIVPGFFNLTFITNRGAAFGFLNGDYGPWRHIFFVVVAIVALVFLVTAYKQFKDESRLYGFSICLIASGAIGNLIDRLRLGAVIDFLDFYVNDYHWPVFNVADSAITVGVALFVMGHLFLSKKQKKLQF
nr:signal peptidase II [Desulfobulbaceae bacterium]